MGEKLSRRRLIQSGIAVTAPLLAGCSSQDSDPDQQSDGSDATPTNTEGGSDGSTGGETDEQSGTSRDPGSQTIHITQGTSPLYRLDPLKDPFAFGLRILNNVFDALYEYGEGIELNPVLATGEPEVERDGQRYIVEIVDDAEFHNGDPLTAEDVVYTFLEPIRAESLSSGGLSMIDAEKTQAIDETTIQFDLKYPYAPFDTTVLPTMIVNKEEREADPKAYNKNPIGSGPFKYVDHVQGEYVELEGWDDYWGEPKPKLSKATFTATSDNPSRVSQLLAGDTDVITGVPASSWKKIENDESVNLYYKENIATAYTTFNCNEGPTANADVRRGILYSVSEQAYIESQYPSAVPVTDKISPVPRPILEKWDMPAEEYAEIGKYEYDPEKAASLLEGNVPDPWKPTLVSLGESSWHEWLSTRLRGLSEYGLTIEPEVQTFGIPQFNETVFSGNADDYQIYSIGHTGALDPDTYMYDMFHKSQAGVPGGQGHFYGDDEFHSKIEEARRAMDRERRRQLYDELIREVLTEAVWYPLSQTGNSTAARSNVQGVSVPVNPNWGLRLCSTVNNVSIQ